MTQPTSKRTACDRCRAHKLRCTQSARQGRGPCARCGRAGAECVTSDAKPTGRPRKDRGASLEDGPVPVGPVDVARVSVPEGLPEESIVRRESNGEDGMTWMGYDPAIFLTDPQPKNAVDLWPAGEQMQYLATDMTWPNSEACSGLPEARPVADLGPETDALLPTVPTTDDILTALARLSESISQQLSRSKAFQRERHDSRSETHTPPRAPNVNGVAVALKCTSDFAKILQALPSGAGKEPGETNYAHLVLLDTPAALLVLSNYIQLIHLYNTIFHCLCRNFREKPDSIGKCPASADSQFQVAGVSTIDGRLYVKLLIQVIEHQIGGLEELLGLPTQFSVTRGETQHHGIFGDSSLRGIADIVMSRVEDSDGSARARITSLRDVIQEAKGLL